MIYASVMRGFVPAILFSCLLGGCAGSNFVRSADESFKLGTSTPQDVEARMGGPERTGTINKNGVELNEYIYAYAVNNPAESAAKGQHFFFYQNVLVGTEYVSSFSEDSTDFDETKASQIKKGVSTKADAISLLGKPDGQYIYPLIENKDDRALIYLYTRVTGAPFATKIYSKSVIVSYDANGVVDDVTLSAVGNKPN